MEVNQFFCGFGGRIFYARALTAIKSNELFFRMLHRDVTKRQTAKQILSHPALRKIETIPKK